MSILSLKTETIVTMGSNLENMYQTNINYLQDSMDLQTKNYEESKKEIKGLLQKFLTKINHYWMLTTIKQLTISLHCQQLH